MPKPFSIRFQATVLTGEGGRLRRDLEKGKDYEVVPEAIWKALSAWYGGSPALPRQVEITRSYKDFVSDFFAYIFLGCTVYRLRSDWIGIVPFITSTP